MAVSQKKHKPAGHLTVRRETAFHGITVVVDFAPGYETATATIQTDLFFDVRGDADMDGVLDFLDSDGAPGFTIYGCAQWTKLPIQGDTDDDDDDDDSDSDD